MGIIVELLLFVLLQDFETELMAQASKQPEDMEEDKRGWERVEIEAERFVSFCLLFINLIGHVKEYIARHVKQYIARHVKQYIARHVKQFIARHILEFPRKLSRWKYNHEYIMRTRLVHRNSAIRRGYYESQKPWVLCRWTKFETLTGFRCFI